LLMLLRAFGFYLSSYITVVIALDRYMSIVHPLKIYSSKRCKMMLFTAYSVSFAFSFPQSIIFHVESHPLFPWFFQCVTFNFFQSQSQELAYDIFSCVAVYLYPLVVIVMAYTLLIMK
ncbi:gonadotropin-releasing hormone II receptor, partial [Biomphalaria pfeifferi]